MDIPTWVKSFSFYHHDGFLGRPGKWNCDVSFKHDDVCHRVEADDADPAEALAKALDKAAKHRERS